MWRFLVPIGLFAALFTFFFAGLGRDKETLPSPLIGKPAPQFELSAVDDPTRTVSSRQFAGRPYMVNIWGTWCPGCRQEHEVLLQIAQRNLVPIIGIDWKDDAQAAQRWLRERGNPYAATAFDGEGRVAIDWGAYGAPETFLVDANGIVIHKHVGPLTMAAWEADFVPRISGGSRE
jgi:cytochrome c biogenesis protein CcmG, thiol:disulfide interchange protein DsbE